jgi:hypothetical protein
MEVKYKNGLIYTSLEIKAKNQNLMELSIVRL